MEIELTSDLSDNAIFRSIDVWNGIEDYKLWKTRIFSYNYLLTHYDYSKTKYRCYMPSKQDILSRCERLIFDDLINNYNINRQMIDELADIIFRFSERVDIIERIQDRLDEIEGIVDVNITNDKKTKIIYDDKQNVHSSSINNTVKGAATCLYNLYKDHVDKMRNNVFFNDLTNSLSPMKINVKDDVRTMIYEYSSTFNIGLTINQVLKALWCLINDVAYSTIKKDLIDRLKQELIEMNGLCTSGHLSRLINVIQGFDLITKNNPSLEIRITSREQITSVVYNRLNKFIMENDLLDYVTDCSGIVDRIKAFIKNEKIHKEYDVPKLLVYSTVNKYFNHIVFTDKKKEKNN